MKELETGKQEQALNCRERNEDKILLLYLKVPLKDGGGIWRGIFQCKKNIIVLDFLSAKFIP